MIKLYKPQKSRIVSEIRSQEQGDIRQNCPSGLSLSAGLSLLRFCITEPRAPQSKI